MNSLHKMLLLLFCLLQWLFSVQAQKRVACIGDSVTEGYGLTDSADTYPAQLQQILGEDFLVGNFGHSGATLLRKGHNPYHKTQAYQKALQFRPDIIVIALGLNDTDPRNWPNYRHEFIGDYTALIEDFRKVNSQVEVYVCLLTPIFSGHRRFLSGTRAWFDEIQNLIPYISKVNNAELIDNHTILVSRIDLFDDYLHPNARGAALLAENVAKYLQPIKQDLAVEYPFGSHMVLQRDEINKLYGRASAFEQVYVSFNGKKIKTRANKLGQWQVELPAQPAGGPYIIALNTQSQKIVLEDVLFGDVFLSSGQSNMAFPLKAALGADSILREAQGYSQVRIFKNKPLVETTHVAWPPEILKEVNELNYFSGSWQVSSRENIGDFSAIAYMAALEVHKKQNIPVGIVDISVGGSNTESWIPRPVLEHDNLLASYIHSWRYSDFIQDFCRERAAKNLELSKVRHQRHPYEPAYNYEAGISRWKDVHFKAVLWYQGESNAHNVEHHEYLFRILVHSWRKIWGEELPFYFVQLSSINRPSWPDFRDSQRRLSNELPRVYMAVSSDLGHPTDVHPRNKLVLGQRLANLLLQFTYGHSIETRSPQPVHYELKENQLVVTFNPCKVLSLQHGPIIRDLRYLNSKGHIVEVKDVVIVGNSLVIKNIKDINCLQYGYSPYSEGNLFGDNGIPVSTFSLKIR